MSTGVSRPGALLGRVSCPALSLPGFAVVRIHSGLVVPAVFKEKTYYASFNAE